MPPKRPKRKAAIEATARFGADRNRSTRRGAQRVTPPVDATPSDKPEDAPEQHFEEGNLGMKAEEGHTEPEDGKAANEERPNEGEASTAPVPEKVRCMANVLYLCAVIVAAAAGLVGCA